MKTASETNRRDFISTSLRAAGAIFAGLKLSACSDPEQNTRAVLPRAVPVRDLQLTTLQLPVKLEAATGVSQTVNINYQGALYKGHAFQYNCAENLFYAQLSASKDNPPVDLKIKSSHGDYKILVEFENDAATLRWMYEQGPKHGFIPVFDSSSHSYVPGVFIYDPYSAGELLKSRTIAESKIESSTQPSASVLEQINGMQQIETVFIVRPGNTLMSLLKIRFPGLQPAVYEEMVPQVAAYNKLSNPDQIEVGQKILVNLPNCYSLRAESGQTLEQIAALAYSSQNPSAELPRIVEALARVNNLTSRDQDITNRLLFIPDPKYLPFSETDSSMAQRAASKTPASVSPIEEFSISSSGTRLIQFFEGCHLKAYKDPVGVWTIGYGQTEGVTKDTKIQNKAEAEKQLLGTLVKFESEVKSRLKGCSLTQTQYDALVSATYNVWILAKSVSTPDGENTSIRSVVKRSLPLFNQISTSSEGINSGKDLKLADGVAQQVMKFCHGKHRESGKTIFMMGLLRRRFCECTYMFNNPVLLDDRQFANLINAEKGDSSKVLQTKARHALLRLCFSADANIIAGLSGPSAKTT